LVICWQVVLFLIESKEYRYEESMASYYHFNFSFVGGAFRCRQRE
jgi:hypothetical protein